MKPRIYIETTIPSYLTSKPSRDLIVAGHEQITREWWETRSQAFELYVSQLVLDEAGAGDPGAAIARLSVIQDLPPLDLTAEVAALASAILVAESMPRKAAADAAHVATAAVHGMDFLVTWNCAHIANAGIARPLARICRKHGYECLSFAPRKNYWENGIMLKDPIVDEIRRIREDQAAKHGFDVKAILTAARRRQRRSKRKIASFLGRDENAQRPVAPATRP